MNILDIAKLAGVSKSTVSRVINKQSGVKEETKKKIEKIINDNNFYQNKNASNLRLKHTNNVGVVLSKINSRSNMMMLEDINDKLQNNYNIFISSIQHNDNCLKSTIDSLMANNISKLIVFGTTYTKEIEEMLMSLNGIRVVVIGQRYPKLSFVCANYEQAAFDVTNEFIEKNNIKNKCLYISAPETDIEIGHKQLLGFQKAMNINSVDFEIEHSSFEYEQMVTSAKKSLGYDHIITATETMAQIVNVVNLSENKKPKICALNGTKYIDLSYPKIAYSKINFENIGEKILKIFESKELIQIDLEYKIENI